MDKILFEQWLRQRQERFARVVPFEPGDRLLRMDFTAANTELTGEILANTNLFIQYINAKLAAAGAKYGIGGYNEHRTIYSRSQLFGPSPTTGTIVQDGAKAPSRWEREGELDSSMMEEETIGYRYADPSLYGMLKE